MNEMPKSLGPGSFRGKGRLAALGIAGGAILTAAMAATTAGDIPPDPFAGPVLEGPSFSARVEASIVTPMILLTEARVDAILDRSGGVVGSWTQGRIEALRIKSDARRLDGLGRPSLDPLEIRDAYDEAKIEAETFDWGETRILEEIGWAFEVEEKAPALVLQASMSYLEAVRDPVFAEELAVFTVTGAITWDPLVHGFEQMQGWKSVFEDVVETGIFGVIVDDMIKDPRLQDLSDFSMGFRREQVQRTRDDTMDRIFEMRGYAATPSRPSGTDPAP
jgi:hypothetical protein